ncbi:MAG: hypothetical protein ABIH76_00775 [Candidatus Bathyarchaeota archaeon]
MDTHVTNCHSCDLEIDWITEDRRPTCDDCFEAGEGCFKKDPCKCEIYCGCGNPMGSLEEEWGVCRDCK